MICPIRVEKGTSDVTCLQERCAWWVKQTVWKKHPAGVKKEFNEDACAIKVLAGKEYA